MTLALVRSEVERFLGSAEPGLLCIIGRWGVGKTYAWNQLLEEARQAQRIVPKKYAYVSLFGRASIDDIRKTIVENTVSTNQAGLPPSIKTLDDLLTSSFAAFGFAKPFLGLIPKLATYETGINRLLYLAIREQLVCIDDVERANDRIQLMDVLGIAGELKEQKSCKVVLLLNRDALSVEREKDFSQQLEKIANVALIFSPTPQEAASIAVTTDDPYAALLRDCAERLGLVNIRVIQHALHFSVRIHEIVGMLDERVLRDCICAVTLGCYCKFQPAEAPPFAEVRDFNDLQMRAGRAMGRGEPDAAADRTMAQLTAYGWTATDPLDIAIFDGIDAGAFDARRILQIATEKADEFTRSDRNHELTAAWVPYHTTFNDNSVEIIAGLRAAVIRNVNLVSANQLSSVTAFFRQMGQAAEADALIQYYMNNRRPTSPRFWDIREHHFVGADFDPAIAEAFRLRWEEERPAADPLALMRRIAIRDGWNEEQLNVLADVSVDDYETLFRQLQDDEVDSIPKTMLRFARYGDATEEMKTIAAKAKEALLRIAADHPLNRLRVATLGVVAQ